MSNIGSRTSVLLLPLLPVLGYYYASNIVLEESMMQVSFGLTTVLLGVCWFVVDICDDLAIYVFYKDV